MNSLEQQARYEVATAEAGIEHVMGFDTGRDGLADKVDR